MQNSRSGKNYSFKLIDQKGLHSPKVKVSPNTNKLPSVSLYHNNSPITAENEANAYPINNGGSTGAITLQARAKAGTAITGNIEKKVFGSNSWIASGTVSDTTNADFNLPALGNSENEALYKITLKANAAGYSESESKTSFVKLTKAFVVSFRVAGGNGNFKGEYSGTDTKTFTVLPDSNVTFTATLGNGWEIDSWNVNGGSVNGTNTAYQLYSITATQTVKVTFKKSGLPVLKLVQNFNDTDNSHKNISAGVKGYVTEDIIPDAAQHTENKPLVIYNTNSAAKFSLSAPSGAEAHYSLERLGSGGNILTPDSTGNEISLQAASKFKIKVWTVKAGVTGTETELYVQVKTGLNTYKELKNTVQNAPVFDNGIKRQQSLLARMKILK